MMTINQIPYKPIVIGKIGSCYGVRGWLKVFSFTEDTLSIFDYQPWFIKKLDKLDEVELENWRYHNKAFIIKIKSINNRNVAHLLINSEIIISSSNLPKLEHSNYYWKDLIGCNVITTKGYNLGKVIDMMKTGSNDVLIINSKHGDIRNTREWLVPFIDNQVIKKIDLVTQIIEIDWNPFF